MQNAAPATVHPPDTQPAPAQLFVRKPNVSPRTGAAHRNHLRVLTQKHYDVTVAAPLDLLRQPLLQ
jgi:hypothetical protein